MGDLGNDIVDGGKGNDYLFGGTYDYPRRNMYINVADGDDILISRDGYDYLNGQGDCDLYRIYPTHSHYHYFEEGCTQVVTQSFETIEFRTNDDRCAVQVDVWELT